MYPSLSLDLDPDEVYMNSMGARRAGGPTATATTRRLQDAQQLDAKVGVCGRWVGYNTTQHTRARFNPIRY